MSICALRMNRLLLVLSIAFGITACGSNPPAPVIDRMPTSKTTAPATTTKPAKPVATKPVYKAGDWRPSSYVVKKGDTLYSIGLEYGYDYKDIAQANNIPAPYSIKVGQTLKLSGLDDKTAEKTGTANSDGVVTYPINGEPNTSASTTTTSSTTQANTPPKIVALSEPKAIREPYSDEALKKTAPIAPPKVIEKPVVATTEKPVAAAPATTKPDSKPDTSKPDLESTEDIDWAWPTKGKVVANFNESSNKGLDIAGTTGQAITAAAPGKVIYSGSDLRGYGKLVIIKHNKAYLSVYAHNSAIVVKEGQQVTRGQKIAEMGNTDSDTVKLHFEIRRQGKSVDPSKYLSAN